MKNRLVIKVGSSIVSNGDILVLEQIEALCEFIANIKDKFDVILVSSGAVASGYTKLHLDKSCIENKQALASIGQPLLMAAYKKALKDYNIIPAQLLLIGSTFDSRKRTAYAKKTIEILLENNILPIINENDSIAQGELVFGDNDRLSAYVAHYFDADMLIILSDVYGYYDKNPLEFKDAKLIKNISNIKNKHFNKEQKTGSKFSIGGIVTKLIAADFLLKHNKKMFLCSGFDLNPSLDFLLYKKHNLGSLFDKNKGIEI
ncbi:glutamate 5-kinase [Helicobacter sp. MIT 14-3879]|uniref:glutamate 5-kinase n=1 Tax=Helicobacter sp. MIT 14-3879 TaxID=2040649 RepID=UPI000E1E510D|nr:glutamate 5-kinase [Helicobacter sp. MIT 14-3879]RDU62418.1 glutamate 5-kinase [Helicobacter sp. MIT 14-3879]